VRDHDLAEMAAPLEMAVGCLGLGKRERPIDHGAQAVQRDGPVHHLKISYAGDPSSMEELADRVGELKAAKSDLDAYLERLKALFVASGRDEAEGVLFRVVLSAESVARQAVAQLQLLCADRQGEARGVSRRRFE
jgi:hypothetical protein